MKNFILFIFIISGFISCGAIDSMKYGFEHSNAVSANLEKTVGVKNFVGFKWKNGVLNSVDVTFDDIPRKKSLEEVIEISKSAIIAEFKQTPTNIVIGFSVKP